MRYSTLLTVLTVGLVIANNSLSINKFLLPESLSEVEVESVDCIAQVLYRYNLSRSLFVYSYNGSTIDIITKLALRHSTRITRTDLDLSRVKITKVSHFVLVLMERVSDLKHYFGSLVHTLGFSSMANYLVVYKGEENLDLVFETLAQVYAMRSIVLDKYNKFYKAEHFGKNCGRSSKAEFMFECKDIDFLEIFKVYSIKMRSLYGCPVRALALTMPPYVINVSDSASPGFEVNVFRTAAEKLNFTEIYVKHDFVHWGFKYGRKNGNYTFMSKALYENKGDVMFGMVHANESYLGDFHGSMPYLPIDYTFFVPAAKQISPWKNIIRVFTLDMWVIIICTIVSVNFLILAISQFIQTKENYSNCVYLSMHVLGTLLSQGQRVPKSSIIRYLLMTWSVFGFLMTSCYQSSIVSILTTPTYEPPIDSLRGIIEANLFVTGQPSMRPQFAIGEFHTMEIYKRWNDCPVGITCVNITATKRNAAAFANTRNVRYYSKNFLDKNGRSKIQQLPILITTNLWMMLRKGFPLIGQFNRIILLLRQSGIMSKWITDATYKNQRQAVVLNTDARITLNHFRLPFCIYLVGMFATFVIFLCEIVMSTLNYKGKLTRNQKKPGTKQFVYLD